MSIKFRSKVSALFVVALVFCAAGQAAAAPAPHRVVIVLAPYLTWEDVLVGPMPVTRQVASHGLVADMNDHSGAGAQSGTTPAQGALMLSAGAPMIEDPGALTAFDASEVVGTAVAADVYRQLFGRTAGTAAVLYLGLPQQVTANAIDNPGPVTGGLADAAHRVGAVTAAIGCSDLGKGVATLRSRPAGIVASSSQGGVDLGDVSEGLLATDTTAPYGVRTDAARLGAAYAQTLAESAGPGGSRPVLIVIDPGDLVRCNEAASASTSAAAAAERGQALRNLDDIVAVVRRGLVPGDTLMIVAQAPYADGSFAPLIDSGPLGAGIATSPSTHRDGIVTLPDVSATAISALGGTVPSSMVGSALERGRTMGSSSLAQRVNHLQLMANTASAVEAVRLYLIDTYVSVALLVLLLGAFVLYRTADRLPRWTASASQLLLLLVACVPLAAMIQFALVAYPTDPTWVVLLLVIVSTVLVAALWYATRGRPATWPLIAITGAMVLLLTVDQWFGAPLSWVSIFGYSPLAGDRYYGIGNEMGGLLLGSALVAAALVLDTWRDARWAPAARRWGWPLLGLIVLVTSAAPMLGANVGALAWAVVAFLVGWLILNGYRVWTWRNALIALVLVIVILVGFGAADVLRGSGAETHLGRLITDIGQSGLGPLWIILARKAVTNLRVLGETRWTWLVATIVLIFGYMRWKPGGEFKVMRRDYPAFSATVIAALCAGVVGYFSADSGIVIPALMLMPVAVAELYLMIARASDADGHRA